MGITIQVETGCHLCCLGLVDLREILGKSSVEPRHAACMEKLLEVAPVGWGTVSGNDQGETNNVSQVIRELRFGTCLCLLAGWGRAQQRSNGACQCLSP